MLDLALYIQCSSNRRRGKAPPVEPFNGENEAMRLEDWLRERAATWNDWTEEDRLLQLAGHLRGRALQEWELISDNDKGTFSGAVQSLKSRLDPGSKTLAAQDFRHTVQSDSESVADYICRLERNFRIAYGRDGISTEARHQVCQVLTLILHCVLQQRVRNVDFKS